MIVAKLTSFKIYVGWNATFGGTETPPITWTFYRCNSGTKIPESTLKSGSFVPTIGGDEELVLNTVTVSDTLIETDKYYALCFTAPSYETDDYKLLILGSAYGQTEDQYVIGELDYNFTEEDEWTYSEGYGRWAISLFDRHQTFVVNPQGGWENFNSWSPGEDETWGTVFFFGTMSPIFRPPDPTKCETYLMPDGVTPTGENCMASVKRAVVVANDCVWYESVGET